MNMTRPDGRTPDALRQVRITRGFTKYAEGSVLIEMGETRVLCNASIEDKVPQFLKDTGRGWVTAEYSLLPRSTHTRTQRESASGRTSGRSQEIQRLIGRSLRSVIDLSALGERTVILDCDVLQADGGTRTASITGAFISLVDALVRARDMGLIKRIPVYDYVAAVSVGIVEAGEVLDLTYEEDSSAEVDMNVIMTGKGEFIEIQGTAEGRPFGRRKLESLLGLAESGIARLLEFQKAEIGGLW